MKHCIDYHVVKLKMIYLLMQKLQKPYDVVQSKTPFYLLTYQCDNYVFTDELSWLFTNLTCAIFETGAYGVPSKSKKSFICGGVVVVDSIAT